MAVRLAADNEVGTDTVSVRLPRSFVKRIRGIAAGLNVNLNTFLAATFVWGNLPKDYRMDQCLADFSKMLGRGPVERVVISTWDVNEAAALDAIGEKLTETGLIQNYGRKTGDGQTITSYALTVSGEFVAEHYLLVPVNT